MVIKYLVTPYVILFDCKSLGFTPMPICCVTDDTIAWPHATAAKYGRCSRTQVSKIMSKLMKVGAVTRVQKGARGENSSRAAIYKREI